MEIYMAGKKGSRTRYSADEKATFKKAIDDTRGKGKPWQEAFEAVKAAGYKGSLPSLQQMFAKPQAKAKPAVPSTNVPLPERAQSTNKKFPQKVQAVNGGLDMNKIFGESVNRMVHDAIFRAFEQILVELKKR